ncbi:MAG: hypothetical protein IT270_06155 [Saprospiraceae bacterium]|nr:hypothetical protein [Saprospiraceae bacterium]
MNTVANSTYSKVALPAGGALGLNAKPVLMKNFPNPFLVHGNLLQSGKMLKTA